MALECPKCIGMLEEREVGRFEKKPVTIDQCAICGGYWFDKGEINVVLSLKDKLAKTATQFDKNLKKADVDKKDAQCPRCKKPLGKLPAMEDNRLMLDVCDECLGCWLDPYELAVLQRGGPIKRAWKKICDFHYMLFRRERIWERYDDKDL